jgi:uncharacterized membrane protein
MIKLSTRRTTRTRRKIAVTLVGVLALLGISAYAVYAASGKADFSIAPSPGSQTVSAGQATSYTVTVSRVNGFSGSVTLSASNLPSGATASWKLSNGTTSNVVPPGLNSATLTVQTASSTPTKSYYPIVTGTSGNLSHATAVTLVVQPATQPNFVLAASPASQTVLQGDSTSYAVNVNRTDGFNGPVSLSVAGLPSGATAAWSPSSTVPATSSSATLTIQTANNTSADNYNLAITGTGTVNGSTVFRFAAVTLVVEKTRSFQITGNVGTQLSPGTKAPLNLTLTNPYNFDLKITNLAVAVEEGTSKTGCSGTQNFRITPIPAARYPVTLPAGQTKTLGQLGVADGDKPQVEMLNQPWNQQACMNATISLDYGGSAGK